MGLKKSNKISLSQIYGETFSMVKKNPVVLLPFAVMTLLEFVALTVWYCSPRMPLRLVLGPPIRTFFGEQFLHFPYNFVLLPKLMANSKVFLAVAIGSFLTCLAVALLYGRYQKKPVKFTQALKSSAGKYLSAFCVVLLVYVLYFACLKVFSFGLAKYFAHHRSLLFLGGALWLGPISSVVGVLVGVSTQALFVYAIPLLVISQKKLLPALGGAVLLLKKMFFRTMLLLIIPLLIYVPILVLNYKMVFLMDSFFPEIVLVLMVASTLVSTLLLDPLITCSTTLLYLRHAQTLEQ